jgi:hypothetical protein
MADALAQNEAQEEGLKEPDKRDLLEMKRKALQDPRIKDFIKHGPMDSPQTPGAAQFLSEEKIEYTQLNVRVPVLPLKRLKRAAFEQQQGNLQPDTVQEILMQALNAELRKMGY